jgi:hypothetical protein
VCIRIRKLTTTSVTGIRERCPGPSQYCHNASLLRYFERLSRSSSETKSINFLVFQSFQEQKNLNLSWYEKISSVAHYEAGVTRGTMKDVFNSDWRVDQASQTKMQFYHHINSERAVPQSEKQALPNDCSKNSLQQP